MHLHWAAGSGRFSQGTQSELTPFWSRAVIWESEHIQPTLGARRALHFTEGAQTRCPALQEASHFHKVQPNSSSSSDSSCGSKSNHSLSPSVRLIPLFSFSWHTRFGRGAHSASLPSGASPLVRRHSAEETFRCASETWFSFPRLPRGSSTHLQITLRRSRYASRGP